MHFLDTNILIYSISCNPADAIKRRRAIALLDRDEWALSVQVLQEFYVQATRQTRADKIPQEIAVGLIESFARFSVQAMTATQSKNLFHSIITVQNNLRFDLIPHRVTS